METLDYYLSKGISRCILGSAALKIRSLSERRLTNTASESPSESMP